MKVIIFDFDGTIADSFQTLLTIANRLAAEFGYPRVHPEDVKQLKNLSSREIIRLSGVSFIRLPFLLRRMRLELKREIRQLKPIIGIRETLLELKQQGYHLGIATSNSRENVVAFLESQGLTNLFDFVGSGMTILGKERIIKRVIRQHRLDPATVIYVGDETRDIEAARRVKVKVISVGWGFNAAEVLAEHSPDALIYQPVELINVVKKL